MLSLGRYPIPGGSFDFEDGLETFKPIYISPPHVLLSSSLADDEDSSGGYIARVDSVVKSTAV